MTTPGGIKVTEGVGPEVDTVEVTVDGELRHRQRVEVANQPSSYPISPSQVTQLTPQKDALTDAQLRATPVPTALVRSDGQTVGPANPLPISGTFSDENGVPFGDTNRLPVDIGANLSVTAEFSSVVSTGNSRQVPLAANEVFVGQWEEVVDYAAITATIFTDAWSTALGAVAQFSADGVDVIDQTGATIPPNQSAHFGFSPKARYFRIVYQNGPVAQTVLEVEVSYRFNAPVSTQAMLDAPTYGNYVGDLTKSALIARKDGPGEYVSVRATEDSKLQVHDESSAGRYAGGKSAVATVVSNQGDTVLVQPAAGNAVRVAWVYAVTDPTAETPPVITVKLGATPIYSAFALSHWEPFTGALDEPLVINLSSSATVAVTVHYEEV